MDLPGPTRDGSLSPIHPNICFADLFIMSLLTVDGSDWIFFSESRRSGSFREPLLDSTRLEGVSTRERDRCGRERTLEECNALRQREHACAGIETSFVPCKSSRRSALYMTASGTEPLFRRTRFRHRTRFHRLSLPRFSTITDC